MSKINLNWIFIAGPCAAENSNQILSTALKLKELGIPILRAGLWKPRTSSDSWQGVGDLGLKWLLNAKNKTGVLTATEVRDEDTIRLALENEIDYLWIGSRNAQNYVLLEQIGQLTAKSKTPIILKRSMSSSLDEWLGSASYIARHNSNIILCERGIRGYSPDTRNILDLQTAYLAKLKSPYKVIIDVSHAAGRRDLILPMAKAVKAAGFDGLMIESHPDPDSALTDSFQQIDFDELEEIVKSLAKIK